MTKYRIIKVIDKFMLTSFYVQKDDTHNDYTSWVNIAEFTDLEIAKQFFNKLVANEITENGNEIIAKNY